MSEKLKEIPTNQAGIYEAITKLIKEGSDFESPEVQVLMTAWAKLHSENPNAIYGIQDQVAEIRELMMKNPKYRNYQRRKEITAGIEGGVDLFNAFSNIAASKRQIRDAEEAGDALVRPEVPPLTPKSTELENSTEEARRDRHQPLRMIDPILQRNLDLLKQGLSTAKTASTGQAGVYGSLAQNSINQARRGTQAMIPQIDAVRRQQDQRYDRLVATGINEDRSRSREASIRFGQENRRYLEEAKAAGALGAIGNENLATQRQNIGKFISRSLQPISTALSNNLNFANQTAGLAGTRMPDYLNAEAKGTGQGYQDVGEYNVLSNINPKYGKWNKEINSNLEGVFSGTNIQGTGQGYQNVGQYNEYPNKITMGYTSYGGKNNPNFKNGRQLYGLGRTAREQLEWENKRYNHNQ